MEIVFLQNSATQPRCHKRYRSFIERGVLGTVYSFHRNWYNINLPKDIEIHSLGEIRPGGYARRLLFYIKQLRPVFKRHREATFYCYGLDMAFVAFLFHRRFVYEESDLEYLSFKSSFARKFMIKLDKYVQKQSKATVLTSQGFVEYLYEKRPQNVFVLPNKLSSVYESIIRPLPPVAFDMHKLKFAFIGLLRYGSTLTPFIEEMLAFNPNYEFHFWGDGGNNEKETVMMLCSRFQNVVYHGPFRNPEDLPNIYSSIDVNFVCYEAAGINERVAEPNKLYESLFYLKPMLVSPHTYLSKVVSRIGNGFVLDCHNRRNVKAFFNELSERALLDKVNACTMVDSKDIMDNKNDIVALLSYISD